jgi:molecular chaperone GrpE
MKDEDATRPKRTSTGAEAPGANGVDGGTASPGDATMPEASNDGDRERATLRTELAELKDRWLRERADLENFKRRALLRFGSEALLKDLLPVIDNLHRALAHARAGREDDPILQGVELVLRGFDDVLERHGVKVVPARGEPFDPNRHEAISHVESEAPANTVIDEHQRGYVLHDRLLRPALVTVGKGPRPGDEAAGPSENIAKRSDDA